MTPADAMTRLSITHDFVRPLGVPVQAGPGAGAPSPDHTPASPAPRCLKPAASLCGERAGYAFHWCALPLGHAEDECRCACGHTFEGTPF